jgi:hypothetical protein
MKWRGPVAVLQRSLQLWRHWIKCARAEQERLAEAQAAEEKLLEAQKQLQDAQAEADAKLEEAAKALENRYGL